MNTLFYLAVILFTGLLFSWLMKLVKLPNVTGYLIGGLLIGPYCLKLLPVDFVEDMDLVSEMALAFIAFSIGSEFQLSYLKKVGLTPIGIAVMEAFAAATADGSGAEGAHRRRWPLGRRRLHLAQHRRLISLSRYDFPLYGVKAVRGQVCQKFPTAGIFKHAECAFIGEGFM